MRPPGRPKGSYRSAQREGTPVTERRLLELTGNHAENPTLDLRCREVFARGQKPIRVSGPLPGIEDEIAALHRDFWRAR